jgi:hypothetical protein
VASCEIRTLPEHRIETFSQRYDQDLATWFKDCNEASNGLRAAEANA